VNAAVVRLAVLGDPLEYTRSPELHRAGLAAVGLAGTSEALRVPPARLGEVLAALAADGHRGVNLTHPLKQAALAHLADVSAAARRAASVNTVSFDADATRGDTTDGPGFLDLLAERGRAVAGAAVALLGAGGASRSLAGALLDAGARVTAIARRPESVRGAWSALGGAACVAWDSDAARAAVREAGVVVNGTPLGGAAPPWPVEALGRDALVVDLVYGPQPTPWVRACRASGLDALDGLGLLVHQARRSLSLWTGREVPLAPLAAAVGWPR
jgi:shikimate dehydrogenase